MLSFFFSVFLFTVIVFQFTLCIVYPVIRIADKTQTIARLLLVSIALQDNYRTVDVINIYFRYNIWKTINFFSVFFTLWITITEMTIYMCVYARIEIQYVYAYLQKHCWPTLINFDISTTWVSRSFFWVPPCSRYRSLTVSVHNGKLHAASQI